MLMMDDSDDDCDDQNDEQKHLKKLFPVDIPQKPSLLQEKDIPRRLHSLTYAATAEQKQLQSPPYLQLQVSCSQASTYGSGSTVA